MLTSKPFTEIGLCCLCDASQMTLVGCGITRMEQLNKAIIDSLASCRLWSILNTVFAVHATNTLEMVLMDISKIQLYVTISSEMANCVL